MFVSYDGWFNIDQNQDAYCTFGIATLFLSVKLRQCPDQHVKWLTGDIRLLKK